MSINFLELTWSISNDVRILTMIIKSFVLSLQSTRLSIWLIYYIKLVLDISIVQDIVTLLYI